jgi:hypothetical protein
MPPDGPGRAVPRMAVVDAIVVPQIACPSSVRVQRRLSFAWRPAARQG